MIDNVQPGRYWVQINSSRGFASSVTTAGGIDLQHEPLVVGAGGSSSPIEVTMRDEGGRIEGTVESTDASVGGTDRSTASVTGLASPVSYSPFAYVYCLPLSDSTGQFAEVVASPDGKLTSPQLSPGVYRVLAFKHQQSELEYRNPEAMQIYDAKGQIVRIGASQTQHLRLQLISGSE